MRARTAAAVLPGRRIAAAAALARLALSILLVAVDGAAPGAPADGPAGAAPEDGAGWRLSDVPTRTLFVAFRSSPYSQIS